MSTTLQLHRDGDCGPGCPVCDFEDECEHSVVKVLWSRYPVCERCGLRETEDFQ